MIPTLKQMVVQYDQTLRDALSIINENAQGTCFVVKEGKLIGVITDGDIRRALLNDVKLDELVVEVIRNDYKWLINGSTNLEIQSALSGKIRYIPLVDDEGTLLDFACAHRYRHIPIAQPNLTGNELPYVSECIATNWISSKGKFVKEFESSFASYIGSNNAISVSNGTVALHLALLALGIGPGDEVLVPNLTFVAPVNAVLYQRATPVFVDVDPDTLCINPLLAGKAISSKTKAIIPVHLYGHPAEMGEIMQLAIKHNLFVIEDCAEAFGSLYGEQHVGTFGDAAIFSFFGNKTITTGEGGMLVLKNDKHDARARILRDHGMDTANRYWHAEVGYNYRLTNIQAAIGVAQMERVDFFINKKRWIAKQYNDRLGDLDETRCPQEKGPVRNTYWLYTIVLQGAFANQRDEVLRRLLLHGIEGRPVFSPIHEMPPYVSYVRHGSEYPVSTSVANGGLSLPSSVDLTASEIEEVCFTYREIIAKLF